VGGALSDPRRMRFGRNAEWVTYPSANWSLEARNDGILRHESPVETSLVSGPHWAAAKPSPMLMECGSPVML
jgi:hypothetical protein